MNMETKHFASNIPYIRDFGSKKMQVYKGEEIKPSFISRNELKEIILKNGGKVTDSITSKTSLLINNDINSTSSKNKTAKSKGIPIISETDFIQSYLEN